MEDKFLDKVLKESIKDKVLEITKNIEEKIHEGKKCPKCGKKVCECSTMEEVKEEDADSTDCDTYKYHLKHFGPDNPRTQEFKGKCEGDEIKRHEMMEDMQMDDEDPDEYTNPEGDDEERRSEAIDKIAHVFQMMKENGMSGLISQIMKKLEFKHMRLFFEHLLNTDYNEFKEIKGDFYRVAEEAVLKLKSEQGVVDMPRYPIHANEGEVKEQLEPNDEDDRQKEINELFIAYFNTKKKTGRDVKFILKRLKRSMGFVSPLVMWDYAASCSNEEFKEFKHQFLITLSKIKNAEGSHHQDIPDYRMDTTENDKKFMQKIHPKKGALHSKMGIPKNEKIPADKLSSLSKSLHKKAKKGKLSKSDSKLSKEVTLAKTYKKAQHESKKRSLVLTETELVNLIEKIIMKEQKPPGLIVYDKVHKEDKAENDSALKAVSKKLKDYSKTGSKEEFTTDPKHFPKGNGQLAKMKKKAYTPSKAVDEYIENFAYSPGMENLQYDEIKPRDEWMEMNIEGDAKTGNSPKWANSEDTGLGKKINAKRKKNLFGIEKTKMSYNRVKQPIDNAGEDSGESTLKNMFKNFESVDKEKALKEEFKRINDITNYKKKTN